MECFLSADAVSYFVGSLRSAPPYLTGGLSFALEKEVPRLHGMEPGMEPENLCEALGGAQSTSPGSRYYLTSVQRRHPLGTLLEVLIYGGAARLVLAGYPFHAGTVPQLGRSARHRAGSVSRYRSPAAPTSEPRCRHCDRAAQVPPLAIPHASAPAHMWASTSEPPAAPRLVHHSRSSPAALVPSSAKELRRQHMIPRTAMNLQ